VFAAGVALRRLEQRASAKARDGGDAKAAGAPPAKPTAEVVAAAHADPDPNRAERAATHPKHAPAFMAHAVLSFNEQIERIAEVVAVTAVGALLWAVDWSRASWWFVALLLLAIRPLAAAVGLAGSATSRPQRALIGWFGIRGIGSLFYLAYAVNHGLALDAAEAMSALVLSAVVVSIVVHGISVTPLMAFYERRKPARSGKAA